MQDVHTDDELIFLLAAAVICIENKSMFLSAKEDFFASISRHNCLFHLLHGYLAIRPRKKHSVLCLASSEMVKFKQFIFDL